MNPSRFDRISKLLATRPLSRRQAIATSAGLVAANLATGLDRAVAQDATPEVVPAEPYDGDKTMYLFVQSFGSGSITPAEGRDGGYTVTLDHGTGQTIYFGDRPSRDVGTASTPDFLEGLGFSEDNPPNAALIVETETGETDIAVIELYNPMYDPTTRGVVYDVEVLASWQEDLELGLREEPTDLAVLAPSFGSAHLLIDDCPQTTVYCEAHGYGSEYPDFDYTVGTFTNLDSCWNWSLCYPCETYGHTQPDRCASKEYWSQKCNATFPDCGGNCWAEFSWPFASIC